MNNIMLAKIETCLELCESAEDFKKKVLKVTAITPKYFGELALTSDTYRHLKEGKKPSAVLRELYS